MRYFEAAGRVARGMGGNGAPARLCPCCGQQLQEYRFGVRLTPGKARVFDLITRAGENGIATADLVAITGLSARCIKSHIWQINDVLADTGYRIRGMGWGGFPGVRDGRYRLVASSSRNRRTSAASSLARRTRSQ